MTYTIDLFQKQEKSISIHSIDSHYPETESYAQMLCNEMNEFLPIVGIKKKVDSQKKRILISHTKEDKALSDVIYKMLSFNHVPDDDLIYTSCDNEESQLNIIKP